MSTNRRNFIRGGLLASAASAAGPFGISRAFAGPYDVKRAIASGPFQPTWESLVANYKYPEWYRDAKFGIWSHWTAQCQPEQGDWYARRMYIQGDRCYDYHVKTYGHPSKVGFMEIQNLWKADKWDPERLMKLYVAAGAKYFFAMGAHHDNMDCYDSKYHAWNTVNVGPKKDMVGIWAKHARAHGLRFGISNHNSWTPRWFAPAYGYDGEGPLQGVRYDAYQLSKADGVGKWWEGLDPQDLYTAPVAVMPSGYRTVAATRNWYNTQTNLGRENPLQLPAFNQNWFLRVQDSVDKYKPDALYFDTNELPLEQVGMDLVTHYYNQSANANGGLVDVIVNGKHQRPEHAGSFVNDIERGTANEIAAHPWQTDTCIGDWHYSRETAEQNRYKTVDQVARMLLDICSKNGNLMLNIPQRGDGSIDEHEEAFLAGMARWIKVHGEGIFASRPWKIHGEGPSMTYVRPATAPREQPVPYTSQDVRFMTKGGALYAYVMVPPADGKILIKSLATNSPHIAGRTVKAVSMLGAGKVAFKQTAEGLMVTVPRRAPTNITVGLRVDGVLA